MALNRLLVAVDGSRPAFAAARTAAAIAAATGAALRAVYVAQAEGGGDGDLGRRIDEGGRNALEAVRREAAGAGVSAESAVLRGEPFEAVLAEARAWHADAIVVGRTGRSGLGPGLLGSEALRILEFTEVPVIVVPARGE